MIRVVRKAPWPAPAILLGTADSRETSAAARQFIRVTGCQPVLEGYVPEGASKTCDEERKAA